MAKQKKPNATIAKRKLSDAKGDPYSTMTFPVIKAEDHKKINKNDKSCVISIIVILCYKFF